MVATITAQPRRVTDVKRIIGRCSTADEGLEYGSLQIRYHPMFIRIHVYCIMIIIMLIYRSTVLNTLPVDYCMLLQVIVEHVCPTLSLFCL